MKIVRALSVGEGKGEVRLWASWDREVTCCRGKRVAWWSGAEKSLQIRQPLESWGGVVVVVWVWPFNFGLVAWIAERSGLDD